MLDVLHVRTKSTGIILEKNINCGSTLVDLYLTSGQRSERKRWMNFSENTDLVIWMVNLSNYYKLCYEDNETSRLTEDINTYDKYVNDPTFSKTPIFLIFSMFDRYEESLMYHSFSDFCKDYQSEKETPLQYIRDKFLQKRSENVHIFEQNGFDLIRNQYLIELILMLLNGEKVKPYYPYTTKPKEYSIEFSDVDFLF
jgi:hypothetical protein